MNTPRKNRVDTAGARTGNWRATYISKDRTVKRLVGLEIGIFSLNEDYIEIVMTDERGSKLQFVLPKDTALNFARAIGEHVSFMDSR